MNHTENRMSWLRTDVDQLHQKEQYTRKDVERFNKLVRNFRSLKEDIKELRNVMQTMKPQNDIDVSSDEEQTRLFSPSPKKIYRY